MLTTKQFIEQRAEFKGRVVVDNDNVAAYDENNKKVCDFDDEGPEGALIDVLDAIGIAAELP